MLRRPLATGLGITASILAAALACRQPTDPLASSKLATVNAAVEFLNLEGGCWTIAISERVHYLPLNLPDEFRRDGLRVRARLLRRVDYGSYCMVGPVVEILSIQAR